MVNVRRLVGVLFVVTLVGCATVPKGAGQMKPSDHLLRSIQVLVTKNDATLSDIGSAFCAKLAPSPSKRIGYRGYSSAGSNCDYPISYIEIDVPEHDSPGITFVQLQLKKGSCISLSSFTETFLGAKAGLMPDAATPFVFADVGANRVDASYQGGPDCAAYINLKMYGSIKT